MAKIEQNTLPPSEVKDKNKVLRLVSSVAIAHVLVSHKVRLDADDYVKLFSSLILRRDPKEMTCTAFERLLSHFPSKEWQ